MGGGSSTPQHPAGGIRNDSEPHARIDQDQELGGDVNVSLARRSSEPHDQTDWSHAGLQHHLPAGWPLEAKSLVSDDLSSSLKGQPRVVQTAERRYRRQPRACQPPPAGL